MDRHSILLFIPPIFLFVVKARMMAAWTELFKIPKIRLLLQISDYSSAAKLVLVHPKTNPRFGLSKHTKKKCLTAAIFVVAALAENCRPQKDPKISELIPKLHKQMRIDRGIYTRFSSIILGPTYIFNLFLMGPTYYKNILLFFNKTLTEPTYNFCWVNFKS